MLAPARPTSGDQDKDQQTEDEEKVENAKQEENLKLYDTPIDLDEIDNKMAESRQAIADFFGGIKDFFENGEGGNQSIGIIVTTEKTNGIDEKATANKIVNGNEDMGDGVKSVILRTNKKPSETDLGSNTLSNAYQNKDIFDESGGGSTSAELTSYPNNITQSDTSWAVIGFGNTATRTVEYKKVATINQKLNNSSDTSFEIIGSRVWIPK
jgi:hypothetical protein